MTRLPVPNLLKKLNEIFVQNGYEAYLVGGAVRDMIRGKPAHDWDIATNAQPEQVMSIFHKVIPTGIAHGTVTVHFMGEEIEVTTYRLESTYSDGRHPDAVIYAGRIEEDLSRRDFTMNAIALNLSDGSLCDPFHGEDDIKAGLIRTVGNPLERFGEDGLRPIRALRFAAQTGFTIDSATFDAIPAARDITAKISIERFRDEFTKLINSTNPKGGLELMEQTGVLEQFLPEIAAARDVIQADERGHHHFDVLDHMLFALQGAVWLDAERKSPEPNTNLRLAALFHDIGKPATRRVEEKEPFGTIYTFFGHENVGAKMTEDILNRLRYPKATARYVSHLVKQHMFHYESTWTDAAVRRFMVRCTPPDCRDTNPLHEELTAAYNDIFDLRICDVCGMSGTPAHMKDGIWTENILELQERMNVIAEQQNALSLKDLAVTGKDLMAAGIPSGKHLGAILNELLETVIDDPAANNREQLLTIARNLYEHR